MNRIAARAWVVAILSGILLGGFIFFVVEFMQKSSQWVLSENSPFVDNNQQLSEEQRTLDYGTVVDRDSRILVKLDEGRVYSQDADIRKTSIHWIGGRDGNISAPLLAAFKKEMLAYNTLTGTYSYGDSSPVTRLTLSSKVQKVALEAMGNYKGTVAVYNYQTGELLCSVTTPTFDPDNVPADLETNPSTDDAYYNKFIQYHYTPGSIFKIVTLAAAMEELDDLDSMEFSCAGSYTMGVDKITCTGTHGKQNIQEAFRNSCNCAFAQLSEVLGTHTLAKYVEQFGITKAITFDGITTAEGRFDTDASAVNVAWSAIGQFNDEINPCAFLTFVGAIARGGQGLSPYVMDRISVGDNVTYRGSAELNTRIMTPRTAQRLQEFMRSNVADKYGDWNFPGLKVCAKTGTGEVGGNKKPNAMLTGFVADAQYPLAFIVCVEDAGFGQSVCVPIASKVLASCKEVMDS
ncbi:MAG: penicillin-binding protein [Oscillospiraceae bacterium]|nr:penicillin-binding protein [Oscillospiraceae bacterium]